MGDVALPSAALRDFLRILGTYVTRESTLNGLRFEPNPTDVIISTAWKSGTTWVQQICHGLRSGGDMDFEEIGMVVPCLEMAQDYRYEDLQQPQPFQPRMYKTHFWYPACPKGAAKYIIVARQPTDAALSLYNFLKDWVFNPDEIPPSDLIDWAYLMAGAPKNPTECSSQMHHILSWYPHRHDENVLWLHYEDLQQNLPECVRLIAEFLEIGNGDDALQQLVAKQASFDFMKKHSNQFDEHCLKLARNEAAGLPRDAGMKDSSKVRKGAVNAARALLPKQTVDKIDQKWKDVMLQQTGYETYDEMRKGVNEELGRSFCRD